MRGIPAGLMTLVIAAAIAGCGTAPGSAGAASTGQPGSAAHHATPATAGNGGPGSPTSAPGSAGASVGCPSPASKARHAVTITLADNGESFCLRVGDKLYVYLSGTDSSPWLQPLASSRGLVPIPDPARLLARGVTGGSFAAARPGRVIVTSVRPPCRVLLPPKGGGFEPAFPVPNVYPLPSCASTHRFSVWINVTS